MILGPRRLLDGFEFRFFGFGFGFGFNFRGIRLALSRRRRRRPGRLFLGRFWCEPRFVVGCRRFFGCRFARSILRREPIIDAFDREGRDLVGHGWRS